MANIINGTDTGSGGLITTGDSSDELQLQTAETARVTLTNTAVVVNEDGNDVDFRVESDTDENALFVDGASGSVYIKQSTNVVQPGNYIPDLSASGFNDGGLAHNQYSTSAGVGAQLWLSRSKSATIGQTIVASGDQLGAITFSGSDGTNFRNAASIRGEVDGTPGASDMPGRLRFLTTPDGSAALAERMRITSDGYLRMASGSGGIQFNGDTAAANALDDYEEGTWTPTVTQGWTSITYQVQNGDYTKIGNLVTCRMYIQFSGTSLGQHALFGGLPFAVAGQPGGGSVTYYTIPLNETSGVLLYVSTSAGGRIELYQDNDSGGNVNSNGNASSQYLIATFAYGV